MRLDEDTIADLFRIQSLVLEAKGAAKELEELPERAVILAARTKKRAIEEKSTEVGKLYEAAESKAATFAEEDAALAEKQRKAQADIDEARGSYRNVEARSKEMNGYAKRRAVLEQNLSDVLDELARIETVQKQVSMALAALNSKEAEATEAFVEKGTALKRRIAQLDAERAEIEQQVPADVMRAFQQLSDRTGGVAIARLAGGACSACRAPVDAARVTHMRASGNVGNCPQCGRLLVLD